MNYNYYYSELTKRFYYCRNDTQLGMSLHKDVLSVISILATIIKMEFQLTTSSLLETHYWVMHTLDVVLFIYVVARTVQIRARNDNEILSKVTLLPATLAPTLLFLIIRPVLGWVALIFWLLYFSKTAYELAHDDEFFLRLETLNDSLFQALDKLKNEFLRGLQKLNTAIWRPSAASELPT